jgi:HJR/Mrr/RecB family endonuclease
MPRTDHGTKWTAEFVVAAELSRRGYKVAFTQGSHTPVYDLLAATTKGEAFAVDVKGQASKGAWLVKDNGRISRL